ncbi:MAG TPA: ribosomal protein S18-alanine N-acetyltransferase [Pyrinomonadaceae bacterium]|jgi:ribosomal-protein-alanine N-acetyltransferase
MARARLRVELERAGCVIVPMTEHDLLEVVEIEESTGLSQWGWDAYRAELEKPEALMLVARRNEPEALTGRRLGGYIASRINADELHINNIGVWPESRRRGVGGALLGAALDLAARGGAFEAVLEVRAGNLPARMMYERLGFAVVGERKNYYREPAEDAKIMTRRLAPPA